MSRGRVVIAATDGVIFECGKCKSRTDISEEAYRAANTRGYWTCRKCKRIFSAKYICAIVDRFLKRYATPSDTAQPTLSQGSIMTREENIRALEGAATPLPQAPDTVNDNSIDGQSVFS